jgi:hypothetical protein
MDDVKLSSLSDRLLEIDFGGDDVMLLDERVSESSFVVSSFSGSLKAAFARRDFGIKGLI